MTRDELVARARALGVERAELMTRVELHDELVRRAEPDPAEQRRARGWLGVARDLVASVVESGLNLPDAAALIRGREFDGLGPSPVATVTLAQIYAAQGHHARAIAVLDQVLEKEPDHAAARALRERFLEEKQAPAPKPRATIEAEAEAVSDVRVERPDVAVFESPAPAAEPSPDEAPAPAYADLARAEPPVFVAVSEEPSTKTLENGSPEPATVAPSPSVAPTYVPAPRAPRRSACVLVSRAPGCAPVLVWDLGDLAEPGGGSVRVVRYVAWTVSEQGVVRSEGEVPLSERRGRASLAAVEPHAVVRAVLGSRTGDEFAPLLIASEVAVANGVVNVRFRPPAAIGDDVQPLERELALSASGG
jgi:hypothetical protein